jgi:hypothetical protein
MLPDPDACLCDVVAFRSCLTGSREGFGAVSLASLGVHLVLMPHLAGLVGLLVVSFGQNCEIVKFRKPDDPAWEERWQNSFSTDFPDQPRASLPP